PRPGSPPHARKTNPTDTTDRMVESDSVTASPRAVELALAAAQSAADKLARDIVVIDVSERLAITDCFVIASADNDRQVKAAVDEIEYRLRDLGAKPLRRESGRR